MSLLLAACLFATACSGTAEPVKETAEIGGDVTIEYGEQAPFEGYAGRKFKVDGLLVYLFSWEQSGEIRDLLSQLDKAYEDVNANRMSWHEYIGLVEELYRLVINTPPLQKTRTNKDGKFVFRELKVGEKYLVIATDAAEPREDGVQNFFQKVVGPLSPGKNEIHFVEKVG